MTRHSIEPKDQKSKIFVKGYGFYLLLRTWAKT